jgi:hypothetical protein
MSAVDGQGVAATVREHGRLTLPLPGCVSASSASRSDRAARR